MFDHNWKLFLNFLYLPMNVNLNIYTLLLLPISVTYVYSSVHGGGYLAL